MLKITEIYKEYKIMPNLQMHQLRVAAVAKMICDSMDIELDKDKVLKATLLHDMGNVIKFDLVQTQKIFGYSDFETEEAKRVQKEFIDKYGDNEHEATVKIIKEIGLSEDIMNMADENRFSCMCKHKEIDDIYMKIMHYADGRVGPHGILSYEDRMNDAGNRYKNHRINSWQEDERLKLVECGREIEKQIFLVQILNQKI